MNAEELSLPQMLVGRCSRCRTAYTASAYCAPCVRLAQEDFEEKRAILLPRGRGGGSLSACV